MFIDNNSLPVIISYLEVRLEEVKRRLEAITEERLELEASIKLIRSNPYLFFLRCIGYLNYSKERKELNWEATILELDKEILQTELEKLKRIQNVREFYNC